MVRPHLEYANSVWCPYKKGDIAGIEKVQKRDTKLVISLKHLSYIERLRQLKLPTLKYKRLRGDMIEVFKIVHNFYHSRAVVKLNFNSFSTTGGNKFKLQKFHCHYDVRENLHLFPELLISGIVYQITLWRLTLLMHLRIVWTNIGLIKMLFMTTNQI